MSTKNITYYKKTGSANTASVLQLAEKRSNALGIETVVLASIRGDTAAEALKKLDRKKLIVVGTDRERFSPEILKKCSEKGVTIIFSQEIDYQYPENMKTAFRRFGQGMKVVVEDVVLACISGVLQRGMDVISIAGTSWGADTAVVIATSLNFASVKIKEILCMPS
jgi:hypothetical protein